MKRKRKKYITYHIFVSSLQLCADWLGLSLSLNPSKAHQHKVKEYETVQGNMKTFLGPFLQNVYKDHLKASDCLVTGHDAIVTLLKHYKRPDDSPCNEYSQPGGGEN